MLYILENRHKTGGVSPDEEKRKSWVKEAIKLHEAEAEKLHEAEAEKLHEAENKFKRLKSDKT